MTIVPTNLEQRKSRSECEIDLFLLFTVEYNRRPKRRSGKLNYVQPLDSELQSQYDEDDYLRLKRFV